MADHSTPAPTWLDVAPAGCLVTGVDGRIRWANRTLAGWLGRDAVDLVGSTVQDLLTPSGRIHYEAIAPMLALGRPVGEVSLDVRRSDGSTMYLLASTTIEPSNDVGDRAEGAGAPGATRLEVRWACLDVSGRRLQERDLLVTQRRLNKLQQMAAALVHGVSVADIVAVALDQLVDGVKAEFGIVVLFDDSGEKTLREHRSIRRRDLALAIGEDGDPKPTDSATFGTVDDAPRHHYAVLPLRVTDRVLGAIRLDLDREQPYTADEQSLLRAASEMCAQALGRAQLVEQHRRDAERDASLSALLERLEEATTFADRAQLIAEAVVPDHADYATVEIPSLGPEPAGLCHSDAVLEPVLRTLRSEISIDASHPHSLAGGRKTSEIRWLTDIDIESYESYGLDDRQLGLLRTLGPRSFLGLPLVARGTVIGSLLLVHSASDRRFRREDLDFYRRLADACALALENARLYEHERDTARQLQDAMLPKRLPRDRRFRLATYYEAGHAVDQIGGDWYDAFRVSDDVLGFTVGDIVGGGIVAAATMAQLQIALRAYALEGDGVTATMDRIERFASTVHGALASSLVYAQFDAGASTIRFSSAGHPPPVLVSPTEPPRLLWDGRNRLLGVDNGPFVDHVVPAEADTTVLLYTDGLVERRGQTLDEGFDALLELLAERPKLARRPAALAKAMGIADHGDDTCVLSLTVDPSS